MVATVTDVLPYFYVPVPRGFTDDDFNPFRSYLNVSRVPPSTVRTLTAGLGRHQRE